MFIVKTAPQHQPSSIGAARTKTRWQRILEMSGHTEIHAAPMELGGLWNAWLQTWRS
jgi:hypothetical protein